MERPVCSRVREEPSSLSADREGTDGGRAIGAGRPDLGVAAEPGALPPTLVPAVSAEATPTPRCLLPALPLAAAADVAEVTSGEGGLKKLECRLPLPLPLLPPLCWGGRAWP